MIIMVNENTVEGFSPPELITENMKKYTNGPVSVEPEIDAHVTNESCDEPSYYNSNGLSPLQAFKQGLLSQEEYMGFLKGNIIKYTVRCDKKCNGAEDMSKCIDYCNHLKDLFQEVSQ